MFVSLVSGWPERGSLVEGAARPVGHDDKQNRNYLWHRSPALGPIRGPPAARPTPARSSLFSPGSPHGASCRPGSSICPPWPEGRNVRQRERIKALPRKDVAGLSDEP